MNKNKFIGKKRNLTDNSNKDNISNNENINNNINEDSINSTQNSNQEYIESPNRIKDNILYKEGMVLKEHNHWINKIIIFKKQSKHNLISCSADGKIIIYDNYPSFKPLLTLTLFGTGVTFLNELKNGSIIACSFGAFKQIILNYNNLKNEYSYEIINYYAICSTYISKFIELNNENLLFISQQNNIIILEKIQNDKSGKLEGNKINDKFIIKSPIKLLRYEICINILQLKDDLYISGSITDTKYNILVKGSKKVNVNSINFYDEKFNTVYKFNNIYLTKSQENIVKIDNKYVIVGIEMCLNKVNWNNNYGIALINYNSFQINSFYEFDNQISSISLYGKFLYIGDNKGYIQKYEIINKEFILLKNKRIHFYNINSICCDSVYDKEINQNIFILFTGSNDNTIKITSYFNN